MDTNQKPFHVVHRRVAKAGLLAAVVAASSAMTSGSALAAIVCNAGTVPIAVPATTAGVYLNLVTGASGTAAATPGWDVNPWGATNLGFFATAAAGNRYVGTGTVVSVLAAGTMIDASSPLTNAAANATGGGFLAGVTGGYLGVRFLDQASAVRYGWVSLNTTGPNGVPATITGYCYQDDGTGITAGTTPVSLQSFGVD
ncbi:MAG: hypothetical protein J0L88_10110 [Xanthomonadales bacterium]|nr:hypothetical protein [Xanthomonadales bacterium]